MADYISGVRALLVGIDSYDDQSIPRLRGCVEDVKCVEKFIVDMGVNNDHITKLIAPSSSPTSTSYSGQIKPTYDNIIKELRRIRDSGDDTKISLFYIHYSAHGFSLKNTPSDSEKKAGAMWMALSTADSVRGKTYLSGQRLGCLIQQIIENKGCRVCLVLDTCYSGGGFRGDESSDENSDDDSNEASTSYQPRLVELDEEELSDQEFTGDSDDEYQNDASNSRNTKRVESNWMITPTGCTVVAACNTNQIAGEDSFGGAINGVLTHWMLQVLRTIATHQSSIDPHRMPSYTRLRHEVERKIRIRRPKTQARHQTPIIRGDAKFRVLGCTFGFERAYCEVLGVEGEPDDIKIHINVGRCQGVAVGAVYDIQSANQISIDITHVADFSSSGSPINTGNLPEMGDMAFLRQWALPDPYYVKLKIGDESQHRLSRKMEKTSNLLLARRNNEHARLQVNINSDGVYEIHEVLGHNNTRRLPRVPGVSQNETAGIKKVVYIVNHIARFHAILSIPRLVPENSLEKGDFEYGCYTLNGSQMPRGEDGAYIVKANEQFKFKFKYTASHKPPVWVAMFELNADWGISRMYPKEFGVDTLRVKSRLATLAVTMDIPPKCNPDDPDRVLDHFFIFVVAEDDQGPPSWDEISLPPLPTRSSLIDLDYMTNALAKAPPEGRSKDVQILDDDDELSKRAWLALHFQVCTIPQ